MRSCSTKGRAIWVKRPTGAKPRIHCYVIVVGRYSHTLLIFSKSACLISAKAHGVLKRIISTYRIEAHFYDIFL